MKRRFVILFLLVLGISACGPSAEEQAKMTSTAKTVTAQSWTKTPTSTFTPMPTATDTHTATPTLTPSPTETLTPRPTSTSTSTEIPPTPTEEGFILGLPEGDPLEFWQDIPIMPEAISGEDKGDFYYFTVQSSREEIELYYTLELPKYGWDPFATGEGDAGAVLLMFMGNGKLVTVSILEDENSGLYYVMLLIT